MTSDERAGETESTSLALSKRGARRVIQRAFVLVGRAKPIRQHLRETALTTHWTVEDWALEWTVSLDHGRVEFSRGHVGKAQVSYVWKTGARFLNHIESQVGPKDEFAYVGDLVWHRVVDPVFKAFATTLKEVLADPIDDDGVRLL